MKFKKMLWYSYEKSCDCHLKQTKTEILFIGKTSCKILEMVNEISIHVKEKVMESQWTLF